MGDYGNAMMRNQDAGVQSRVKAQSRANLLQLKLVSLLSAPYLNPNPSPPPSPFDFVFYLRFDSVFLSGDRSGRATRRGSPPTC
jgi:hypothetical protein